MYLRNTSKMLHTLWQLVLLFCWDSMHALLFCNTAPITSLHAIKFSCLIVCELGDSDGTWLHADLTNCLTGLIWWPRTSIDCYLTHLHTSWCSLLSQWSQWERTFRVKERRYCGERSSTAPKTKHPSSLCLNSLVLLQSPVTIWEVIYIVWACNVITSNNYDRNTCTYYTDIEMNGMHLKISLSGDV